MARLELAGGGHMSGDPRGRSGAGADLAPHARFVLELGPGGEGATAHEAPRSLAEAAGVQWPGAVARVESVVRAKGKDFALLVVDGDERDIAIEVPRGSAPPRPGQLVCAMEGRGTGLEAGVLEVAAMAPGVTPLDEHVMALGSEGLGRALEAHGRSAGGPSASIGVRARVLKEHGHIVEGPGGRPEFKPGWLARLHADAAVGTKAQVALGELVDRAVGRREFPRVEARAIGARAVLEVALGDDAWCAVDVEREQGLAIGELGGEALLGQLGRLAEAMRPAQARAQRPHLEQERRPGARSAGQRAHEAARRATSARRAHEYVSELGM